MAHSGTLKTNKDHGTQCDYGWIFQDHEVEQAPLFVHIKQCNGAATLRAGDEVTFDKKWNDVKGKYDIDNCTITRASTTSKFESDRSEWPHKGNDKREGKWKHDKHLAMYGEQDPADSARSSSSQQSNKRQRILPRYTAPQITIQIDCGHRRLSMTCRESTPIAAVRRFVAHELRTSEANVRLTFSEGAHAYAQLKDELLVRDCGAGNGSTLGCTVVGPLTFALALLDAPPFLP